MSRKPANIAQDILDYYGEEIETVGDVTWYLDEEAARTPMDATTYSTAFQIIREKKGL